jgi:hypothetical protein
LREEEPEFKAKTKRGDDDDEDKEGFDILDEGLAVDDGDIYCGRRNRRRRRKVLERVLLS